MVVITQDILNQVFREYMKTIAVPEEVDKDTKISGILPKFEQHVNHLTSEYKGLAQVRRVNHSQTRSNPRHRIPFMFRRTVRRPRGWWSR
jgi:hypothetical protein